MGHDGRSVNPKKAGDEAILPSRLLPISLKKLE